MGGKRILFYALVGWIVLAFSTEIKSQSFVSQYHLNSIDSITAGEDFVFSRSFDSEKGRDNDIKEEVQIWRKRSFLSASADSVWVDGNTKHVNLYLGKSVKFASVDFKYVADEILYEAGFRPEAIRGKHAGFKRINDISEAILSHMENNGYPFAELKLDEFIDREDGLHLSYKLEQHEKFVFDTIRVIGSAEVKKSFIYNYLGFQPDELYNESVFKQVDDRLRQLPFLRLKKSTELYFAGEKAIMFIYAEKKKSDRIDGLVGFAPNSANNEGGLLLTGEVNLQLNNVFKSGKVFGLQWKSFLQRSQKLETKLAVPYLLSSPIGTSLEFDLLKFDTFYLNLRTRLGVDYRINANENLNFFYENKSTSLISVDTFALRQNKDLPDINSIRVNFYGVELSRRRLDYLFNPRKGYDVNLDLAVGTRRLVKDSRISRVKFNDGEGEYNVYDSSTVKSSQYRVKGQARYFFPVARSSTILVGFKGEYTIADKIYFNEVFQIGGFQDLRGFDENSIFATSYSLFNVEYRYLLGVNSFLQLFWNGAYVEDRNLSRESLYSDFPMGAGAGFSFETQAGLFSIVYAVGKEQDNPIEFRTAKVHFGLTGYF
jgi:outer membrane protein assembly factor BamA